MIILIILHKLIYIYNNTIVIGALKRRISIVSNENRWGETKVTVPTPEWNDGQNKRRWALRSLVRIARRRTNGPYRKSSL